MRLRPGGIVPKRQLALLHKPISVSEALHFLCVFFQKGMESGACQEARLMVTARMRRASALVMVAVNWSVRMVSPSAGMRSSVAVR